MSESEDKKDYELEWLEAERDLAIMKYEIYKRLYLLKSEVSK